MNLPNHPSLHTAMNNIMSNQDQDEISDEQARQNANYSDDTSDVKPKPTNENLPAIINKQMTIYGDTKIQPTWHQVKNLPGYMLNAIRAGGRKVFKQFTNTPIEDIQMVCTLLNSETEVKAVMNYAMKNGVLDDTAKMEFGGGIEADVKLYKTKDFSFLCVSDFAGKYVYSWVGGREFHVGQNKPKQIK